jgi:hypothetical protein
MGEMQIVSTEMIREGGSNMTQNRQSGELRSPKLTLSCLKGRLGEGTKGRQA